MKYIMTILIAAFSFFARAELPTLFNVYSNGAGSTIPYCNALIDDYNKAYTSKARLIIKQGASGMIAMKEMIKDKNFSLLCYSGTSESVFNRTQYPGNDEDHDLLTAVSIIMETPVLFSSRVDSQYNTLPELIENKKNLIVGYHTIFGKVTGEQIFDKTTTTFVNYKSAMEAMPSLVEGALDVYIDGGGLSNQINAGKLKSLGYLNGPTTMSGVSLNKKFPIAASFKSVGVITTSKNNSLNDIEEMNKRLSFILKDEKFINMTKLMSNVPVVKSVKESNEVIDFMRKAVLKKNDK